MNRVKKMVALTMAALVVLGTTAGLNLQSAYAANPTGATVTSGTKEFEDGEKLSLKVKVVHEDGAAIKPDAVTMGAVVTLENCDFTGSGNAADLKIDSFTSAGTNNKAEYLVSLNNLAHISGAGGLLKFKVKDTSDPAKPYEYTFEYTLTKKAVTSSSSSSAPEPGKSSGNYTITRVSKPMTSSGVQRPATTPKFDITSITGSSDPTIYQTYFVDMTVRVSDAAAPEGLTKDHIILGAGETTDMGSFVFNHSDSKYAISEVEVENDGGGYTVRFENLRYTGNGKKLSFRVKAEGYINDVLVDTIGECKTRQEQQQENNSNKDDDKDDTVVEAETPYVIISKYSYGGGMVNAGQTFPLSMTFYNTSGDLRISNMMITLTMPDGLMLTNSSNTFYVDELGTKSSITKSVQVTARPDAKVQSHNVGVAMKYQYVDPKANARRSAETSETVAIPLAQVDRFDLTSVEIPMEIVLEEENNVTVQFVNKGRSEVYNLTASIEGDILNPGQQQNLGNLASGATGSADFTIKANQAGPLKGVITVAYEDTNMEEKTATIEYFTQVKTLEEMNGGGGMYPGMNPGIDPGMEPGMGDPVPAEKSKLPIYLGIGGAVLLVVAVVVYKQLKRRRKEKEDADL